MRSSTLTLLAGLIGVLCLFQGCSPSLRASPEPDSVHTSLAVGRIVAVITGERSRIYEPAVRFIELINRRTNDRYSIEIQSDDRHFVLALSPGDYELSRVQISEGPFMSMADLSIGFTVGTEPVTYVGTWRFGVDSPRYGRMVAVSVVLNEDGLAEVRHFVREQYPDLDRQPITEVLPQPAHREARLYEVMPYPRYPRYFRRHWW